MLKPLLAGAELRKLSLDGIEVRRRDRTASQPVRSSRLITTRTRTHTRPELKPLAPLTPARSTVQTSEQRPAEPPDSWSIRFVRCTSWAGSSRWASASLARCVAGRSRRSALQLSRSSSPRRPVPGALLELFGRRAGPRRRARCSSAIRRSAVGGRTPVGPQPTGGDPPCGVADGVADGGTGGSRFFAHCVTTVGQTAADRTGTSVRCSRLGNAVDQIVVSGAREHNLKDVDAWRFRGTR